MGTNELIEKQNKEIQEYDKHVLPDTLTADEWQTFIFSGFLNEFSIEQVKANIEEIKNRIKVLEETKYKTKLSIPILLASFAGYVFTSFVSLAVICLIIMVVGLVLELISKEVLGVAFDTAFNFVIKYLSLPLRFLFNVNPNIVNVLDESFSVVLSTIGLALLFLSIIISVFGVRNNILSIKNNRKLEEERIRKLEETKKELDDYMIVAEQITSECQGNLNEIYGQNLIPEIYHNYESLAMLYGYFVCKAAATFQDAAKEYLQDQRANRLVATMERANELLGIIASGVSIFASDDTQKINKMYELIDQNNRSIMDVLLLDNPLTKIYSKAKNTITKVLKH